MADKIRWAVSVTPIEELEDAVGNTYDVIHSSVGKTLGVSGETTITTELGYESKAVASAPSIPLISGVETDVVETLYLEVVSGATVYLSLDGGTTSPIQIGVGEAVLLHLNQQSSTVLVNDVYVSTYYGATANVRYLVDKP